MEIKEYGKHSFKNRAALEENGKCSCYYCCATFDVEKIEEWTDDGKTAICPLCHIDSVVPGEVDYDTLRKATEHWFY